MARPTLKITKPVDPATPAKPLTSRAWRAQRDKKSRTPAPASPGEPAPSAVQAPSPAAAPGKPGSRRRKRPAPGTPRGDARHEDPRRAPPSTRDGNRKKPAGARDKATAAGMLPRQASATKPAFSSGARQRRSSHPKPASPAQSPGRPPPSTGPAPTRTPAAGNLAPTMATAPGPGHERSDDPRLSKRMSELGLCSRREADEWIENGWVKVDGEIVDTLGTRVSPHARIEIDPAAAKHQSESVTILLNKPIGYVSGQAEDGHEPAMLLIRPEHRWAADPSPMRFKPGHLRGLAPAGRLDIDSTGLLVFTQDGRVAKLLIGRDSAIEKEYLVRVQGTLSAEGLKLLQHGLELDGVKLKPARVSWQNEDQLRVVLREGRKRQIRRMCELVGLTVTGLKRVRSGSVSLGPLPLGQWRYLRRDEKF
ncbi:MAG: pseudouridine synthase [Burkholderiales bacterium]|nr:pseudouridine synthase [Burkholderiales bacterium]